MKLSYRIENGLTVLCVDDADMFSPSSEKDRRITLSALKSEARRLSQMISMVRNAEDKNTLSEYLTATNELISIFESGKEFRLSHIFRNTLIYTLEDDKKHRKTARRIIREIRSVPKHRNMEIGGVFDFTALYGG